LDKMLKGPNVSPEMQGVMAQEVNNRMGKAVEDLKSKYERGQGGADTSVDGPTGTAYQKEMAAKKAQKREQKLRQAQDEEDEEANNQEKYFDDEDNDADEDSELRMLREKRLRQIQGAQRQKLEDIGKGHGQYRNIVQDEFLHEVTNSMHTVCHFYHNDFEKCKVMDHHLQILAKRHVETKFIKIDAAKTPFFVQKLSVRMMPTLIFFVDGVAKDKLIGFEGLSDDLPIYQEDEWKTIKLARLLGKAGMINKENIVDDDEQAEAVQMTMEEMRKASFVGFKDEDFDLDELSD
jgi:thiol-disulfide isomerase/thioredoxin